MNPNVTNYWRQHNMLNVGLVRYENQAKIDRYVQALSPIDPANFLKEVIKGAFVKRKEFEHEKEVRIVRMLDSQQAQTSGSTLQFAIPVDFIDEFCIDPRADSILAARLTAQLTAMGIPTNKIIQSKLYHFNSHQIIFS